jgi:acyl-ACP thioesterase
MEPLPPLPPSGRTFATGFRVRLSDMDPEGRVRLDAVARYMQDAATDDVDETGWGAPDHLWVLRSVRIDVLAPLLEDREVQITTWGSGFSALAAARRWSLEGDAGGSLEVDSIWIHLGPDGRPARIGGGFDAYREAAQGRSASTRLLLPDPPVDASRTAWPIRMTDLDLMGHVNNAAYWKAVEDRLHAAGVGLRAPYRARLDYRHPIDFGEAVELAEFTEADGYGLAFVVDGLVKAVARVELGAPAL